MKNFTIAVVSAVVLVPAVSFAAYLAAGDNVLLPSAFVGGSNAYLAGGTVNASNAVSGDLIAVGGTVIISGSVTQDIMVAGGTVNVLGATAEDVRVAGGNLTIGGAFKGELVAVGGQITVTPDATIARDSYLVGGTINFLGTEAGALTVSGGDVRIDGTVGNLTIKKAGKVMIGSHAVVRGNFEYSAPQAATIEDGAKVLGATTFHEIKSRVAGKGRLFAGIVTLWALIKFLIALTAAYLLWYLRRKDMTAVIDGVHAHFWKELLRGFAFLFLAPIAVVILFITVIGAIPAIVLLMAYIALLALTAPVAVIVATSLLAAFLKKSRTELAWYHILLGAVILGVASLIPFVGWIVCLIIYLVSLGASVGVLKTKF